MECVICLLPIETVASLDCGHGFHEPCIKKWVKLNNTCPNCRLVAKTIKVGREKTKVEEPIRTFESLMNVYHFGEEIRPQRNLPGFVVNDSSADDSCYNDSSEVSDVIITRRDDLPISKRTRRHK
jgi:hypothetical protein